MTGYDEGIHLDGATLPDQFQWNGTTQEPLDNAWNDPPQPSGQPTDRVTGNIGGLNPFFWFVRNTGGIYNPLDGGTTNPIINVTPIAQGTVFCNDFSNRLDRDERFGAVVGDSLQFEEYQNENLYFAKVNAYKAMKDDSTIIYTGSSGDAAYENFYNTMDASNIGSFETVNELAADTNTIGLAASENAAIVDTNSIEYFKKSVNDIYLNNTAQHLPLSSTDSSFLDYVTTLSVYSAGNAIYFAAAMIGKELHPGYVAMRRVKPIPVQKEYPIAPFKLFPNPASVSFKIEGDAGCLKQIKVNSTDGKLIKEFKQPLQQEYSIAEITNGFYQVCLIENSGRVSYLKLNIIR